MTTEMEVFLSHKINDKTVTSDLRTLLDDHTDNVKYFISEQIEKGVDFRKNIALHLTGSSCLVLIFTDPNEDWGWCLYETGFFDALSQIEPQLMRRIYCLHNPSTKPPSPIAGLQTTAATKEDVELWLRNLFELTNQTEKRFRAIPKLADDICTLFASNPKVIYSQRSIQIEVDCSLLLSPQDLPDDSTIEGDSGLMAELFGVSNRKTNWKAIKTRFEQFHNSADVNKGTLKEISRAIHAIYYYNIVHQVHGIIFVEQGPKRYNAVISNIKQLRTTHFLVNISFIEAVGGQLQNVPRPLAALLTSIRAAVRIRWEIIRPFNANVRQLATIDARKLRSDLQTCFNNVFLEAEFRGYFSPADVLASFEEQGDKTKFLEIRNKFDQAYRNIWQAIGFTSVKETFGEVSDQPVSEQALSLLESELKKVEEVNRDFLDMAVPRAQLLIRRELAIE